MGAGQGGGDTILDKEAWEMQTQMVIRSWDFLLTAYQKEIMCDGCAIPKMINVFSGFCISITNPTEIERGYVNISRT